ncbi:hypothetical protein DFH07DRAFT_973069 [Mycena maculata]|uniref:Uncharacterized protein n=1 Tax=Mycena maculata TaxID=230809 RepID=A0AAD7HFC7_9AGAR|nr:hypothetical protein DFH07DRAFT_973069 [Mycena maculata]
MSLSLHTLFCTAPASFSLHSSLTSTKPRRSSYLPEFPLPVPIPPESFSMPAPSLGSNAVLPRPKRGAPPIDPPRPRAITEQGLGLSVRVKKAMRRKSAKTPSNVHPAVCAEWY